MRWTELSRSRPNSRVQPVIYERPDAAILAMSRAGGPGRDRVSRRRRRLGARARILMQRASIGRGRATSSRLTRPAAIARGGRPST